MEHQAIRLQRSYFANYAVLVAVIFMCVLLKCQAACRLRVMS